MKLRAAIRVLTPIAVMILVVSLLLSYYRGIRNLPGARMDVTTEMTSVELTLNKQPLPKTLNTPHILISKKRRRLELYDAGILLRVYRIALGHSPVADKIREGDGATPEGTFYVCTKNPESRYHRFIGISYPNTEDAARGLRSGLIDTTQYRKLTSALERGRRPAWDTPLGGKLGLHGGGNSRDWTLGCVALTDEASEELFEIIPYGTPVTIRP